MEKDAKQELAQCLKEALALLLEVRPANPLQWLIGIFVSKQNEFDLQRAKMFPKKWIWYVWFAATKSDLISGDKNQVPFGISS